MFGSEVTRQFYCEEFHVPKKRLSRVYTTLCTHPGRGRVARRVEGLEGTHKCTHKFGHRNKHTDTQTQALFYKYIRINTYTHIHTNTHTHTRTHNVYAHVNYLNCLWHHWDLIGFCGSHVKLILHHLKAGNVEKFVVIACVS